MKTEQMMMYGGLALGAFLLLQSKKTPVVTTSPATVPTGTNNFPVQTQTPVNTSIPTGPPLGVYENAKLLRPDAIGNPNYRLTDAEANQYMANYLDLAQGLKPAKGATMQDAARLHWQQFGALEKRSFLPFNPPSTLPYVAPPANPKSSGGGFNIGKALGTAASIVALLGVDDHLNDAEVEVLITGAPIAYDLLDFFPGETPVLIKNRMDALIQQYV